MSNTVIKDIESLECFLDNCQPITVITGQNGCGKSRFLKYINDNAKKIKNQKYCPILQQYNAFGIRAIDKNQTHQILVNEPSLNNYRESVKDFNSQCEFLKKMESEGMTFIDLMDADNIVKYIVYIRSRLFLELQTFLKENFKTDFEILQPSINDVDTYSTYLQNGVDIHFKKDTSLVSSKDLSSGERFLLIGLLWKFISTQNIPIYNTNNIYLLDEPDCHLHQGAIEDFMNNIKKYLIKQNSNTKVILTTHNCMTLSFFEDENIFHLESEFFILSKFTLKAYKYDEVSEALTKCLYLGFRKENTQTNLKLYEDVSIELYGDDIIKQGTFIENLLKLHFQKNEEKTKYFFGLNNANISQSKLEDVSDLREISLSDYYDPNNIVYIVWPKKPNNPSFDFLTIFNVCIHFYQVTIEENAMKRN
jgi:predicted ATPase